MARRVAGAVADTGTVTGVVDTGGVHRLSTLTKIRVRRVIGRLPAGVEHV